MTKVNQDRKNHHQSMKQSVIELAKKGVPDSEISKALDVGHSFVQSTTTAYWKQIMQTKAASDIDVVDYETLNTKEL